MTKQQNEAKSGSSGGFMPMTNVDGCRWLRKVICRWMQKETQESMVRWRCCADRFWWKINVFHSFLEFALHTDSVQFRIRVLVVSGCNSYGQDINVDPMVM